MVAVRRCGEFSSIAARYPTVPTQITIRRHLVAAIVDTIARNLRANTLLGVVAMTAATLSV